MMDMLMESIQRPKLAKTTIKYTILIKITLFQIEGDGEDVQGGVDAVLFMLASDHVPEAKEDELEEIFKLFFYYLGQVQVYTRGYFCQNSQSDYLSSYFSAQRSPVGGDDLFFTMKFHNKKKVIGGYDLFLL